MEGNSIEGGERDAPVRFAAPAWTLLAVNVIPLVGVLLWEWSAFHVVALYWFENVILGVINVLKIATCSPDRETLLKKLSAFLAKQQGHASEVKPEENPLVVKFIALAQSHLPKLFLIPFFIIHYGMFCLVHGVFVYALLGGGLEETSTDGSFFNLSELFSTALSGGGLIAVLALSGSHLFSFGYHYLGQGEYRRTNVLSLMTSPYARIVVLHIALIAGSFAIVIMGQPIAMLLMLVICKTAADWKLHTRSHEKLRAIVPS